MQRTANPRTPVQFRPRPQTCFVESPDVMPGAECRAHGSTWCYAKWCVQARLLRAQRVQATTGAVVTSSIAFWGNYQRVSSDRLAVSRSGTADAALLTAFRATREKSCSAALKALTDAGNRWFVPGEA